jgi:hypothetical protein
MGAGAHDLAQLVADELARAAPPAALRLADAIVEKVGASTAAVVFYGSCLRRQTSEGVFDFYVLVDDYASASRCRALAFAGAMLPPTVFYVECLADGEVLRAKYALMTTRDFARGAAPGGWRPGIWARFCQPALAVYLRDGTTRDALRDGCVQAILTAVGTLSPLLPENTSGEDLWQTVFRETYAAEMRTETPETIRTLYDAAPGRYERALRGALEVLQDRGLLDARWEGGGVAIEIPTAQRDRARRAWRWRLPARKLVYVAQLLKTAFTFGDWLPYVLWKLERHTGTRLEYTERQRRHPLLYGWPLLFRALRSRDFR